jgi:photosystem II stability/assembly factor-like uncharacterized protein
MKKFYIILVALLVGSGAKAQWVPKNSGTSNSLNDVYFTDSNVGYAVGDGVILKTIDGGENWIIQDDSGWYLSSVHFPSPDIGYAVGNGYTILKTINGGNDWITLAYLPVGGAHLTSVYFKDIDNGFIVSEGNQSNSGEIQQTIDGGESWTTVLNTDMPLFSIFFITELIGYAVGTGGTIIKTMDGGSNWNFQASGFTGGLRDVYFADIDTGFVVGGAFWNNGAILKTTDGGLNWEASPSNTCWLSSVYFANNNIGYAVGGIPAFGGNAILKTTDCGESWTYQYSDTTISFYSVFLTDGDTGYTVGANGSIFKTINGGLPVGINDKPLTTESLKIHPNPASTTITISTPTTPTKNTTLTIHNLNGQALLSRQITEPIINVDASGLVSGVYFVRVMDERTVMVGKFVKQ